MDGEILFAVQERRNANQRRNVPRRTRGGLKGAVVQALHQILCSAGDFVKALHFSNNRLFY